MCRAATRRRSWPSASPRRRRRRRRRFRPPATPLRQPSLTHPHRHIPPRPAPRRAHSYNNYNPDKKVCGKCGGVQSYAEVKGKVKRCPKESCGGAPYRPKLMWGEVQGAFLGRWSNFIKETAANLAKSAEELKPPFRVTHKKTFDKETGEMVMEELPKLDWDAVGDDFLVRQQAVLDKAKARQAAALKSKAEPIVFVKEKGPKSKWKPSKVRRVRARVPRLRLRPRPRPRRGAAHDE